MNYLGTIQKRLKKMAGLKAGYGSLYLMTYRESFHLSAASDEVIVQLKKDLFPDGNMPEEIEVTVQWSEPE